MGLILLRLLKEDEQATIKSLTRLLLLCISLSVFESSFVTTLLLFGGLVALLLAISLLFVLGGF